ncbi:probable glutathione S-transferase [Olea europaea subsp. europaea]|uniref:Glutathione S-transferase n=1 Tax=Olea europaea subsp. europaea TaxID=158383 RepID=A0A8S0QAA4_OLEEU|nr:probable glutathione S-transferase [Olea europaea subsp. europaea]
MEQVKLYGFGPSPFSYRVIWALKLKGVRFEYIEENLPVKSPQLLQLNPIHKKVPVLVHGGKPISESLVILEYIEETWPENPLLPKDAHEKAMARFWIRFAQEKYPTLNTFFRTVGQDQELAIKEALQVLQILEDQALGNKKFFNGETVGLMDLSFGWLAYWNECMEETAGTKIIESTNLPRLHKWIKNFKQNPIIQENLPCRDNLLAYLRTKREKIVLRCSLTSNGH